MTPKYVIISGVISIGSFETANKSGRIYRPIHTGGSLKSYIRQ
jgi:hypothetical protein